MIKGVKKKLDEKFGHGCVILELGPVLKFSYSRQTLLNTVQENHRACQKQKEAAKMAAIMTSQLSGILSSY